MFSLPELTPGGDFFVKTGVQILEVTAEQVKAGYKIYERPSGDQLVWTVSEPKSRPYIILAKTMRGTYIVEAPR